MNRYWSEFWQKEKINTSRLSAIFIDVLKKALNYCFIMFWSGLPTTVKNKSAPIIDTVC
jgi:hypothetical protein